MICKIVRDCEYLSGYPNTGAKMKKANDPAATDKLATTSHLRAL